MADRRHRFRIQFALRGSVLLCSLGVLAVQSTEGIFAGEFPGSSGMVLWVVLFGLALYLTAYLGGLPRRPQLQLLLDLLLAATLVALTGGVHSIFVPLYFGIILAAAFQIRPRAAVLGALLASIAQVAIWGLYDHAHTNELPPLWGAVNEIYVRRPQGLPAGQDASDVFWLDVGVLLAQLLGLQIIGALGAFLAWRQSQERELHREILGELTDGVVTLDDRGVVLYVNDQARHLLGIKYDADAVGRPLSEGLPPANHALLDPLLAHREVLRELALEDNYGQTLPVKLTTRVLRSQRGRIRGVLGVLQDLTMQKQLDAALLQAERLEATGELAASIAHELRNPLASIRGCAQEIGRAEELSAVAKEMTAIVVSESDRLDRIIGEFLQFARMPGARFAAVELVPLLSEVRVLLEGRQQGDERHAIEIDAPDRVRLRADRGQLIQLLLNLGLNALQASPPGAPVGVVVGDAPLLRGVRHDEAGSELPEQVAGVRIEVVDQGPGIPESARERLFDPFFTTKGPGMGSGMGLAIARRIVAEHRGSIEVESEPGRTVFSVWLPLDPAESDDLRLKTADTKRWLRRAAPPRKPGQREPGRVSHD